MEKENNINKDMNISFLNSFSNNNNNNEGNIEDYLYSNNDNNDNLYPHSFYPASKNTNINEQQQQTITNNNSDSRKTYHQGRKNIFKERITKFFLKKKKNKKIEQFDLLEDEYEEESEEEDDDNEYYLYKKNEKFKGLVKNVLKRKRTNEWKEYFNTYKKRVKESQTFYYKLKTIFHIESDFVVIWKTILRIFNIAILFIFFLKYIFMTVTTIDSSSSVIIPSKIKVIYYMINFMFLIDLIISVLVIIFNGGSILTFIKLPLKVYICIPFELKKSNFYLLLPKFTRIDIFKKIFSSWEIYINLTIEFYVPYYKLKVFLTFIIKLLKYLLIFILYAHINGCVLSYLEELDYASSIFYTIEAFTVIGFGEQSPKRMISTVLVILNLFIGVNLFSLMSSNIKELSNKIYSFNRDTSFTDNFEMMIFQMQKSIRKILPLNLRELMKSFLLFRRGLSYIDLKEEYKNALVCCKNSLLYKIRAQLFKFLKSEYNYYFLKVSDDFIYDIFENLKPKIFKSNQVLMKYGEKVNKLYFLLNGRVFATDYNNRPIFSMINNSIFGEYEFITNTLSNFNIRVDPNTPAYGFVLDKKNWENISKHHVLSTNIFIKQIINKRKKHIQWMINAEKNEKEKTILFDTNEKKKKNNENNIISLNDINRNINYWKNIICILDDESITNIGYIEKIKNKKIKKVIYLNYAVSEKDPKYKYSNNNIIKNIDELHREINKIELNFIDKKEIILKNIKYKSL